MLQQTACADLPVILWSVDPEDWRVHDADAVTAHILRHAEPGSVILMHDLTDSSVTAALRVIDALQAQGYEFLTVSELAARSGTALTPVQTFLKYKNIDHLERGIVVALIKQISIYEEKRIEVEFNFADQHQRILDFIEANQPKLRVVKSEAV